MTNALSTRLANHPILYFGGSAALSLAAIISSVAGAGEPIVEQIADLVSGLNQNWQGIIVFMLAIGILSGGPTMYVFRRVMDLQEREGEANRNVQRQIAQDALTAQKQLGSATNQAIKELSTAVRALELSVRPERSHGQAQHRVQDQSRA